MFAAQRKREINDESVCLHDKGKCVCRVNIMTGVFSADSQPAVEGGEREGGRAKSKADRKRGSSHTN